MSVCVNSPDPLPRRRLASDESRSAALEAARALLIEQGPKALTLKAVAAAIGRTHANLLHHFGSAQGLQRALVARITETVCSGIAAAVTDTRHGTRMPGEIVDLVFDSFGRQGGGVLTAWLVLNGDSGALDPVLNIIHRLVEDLATEGDPAIVRDETLRLVVMALGNALVGPELARTLDLPECRVAELAALDIERAREREWQASEKAIAPPSCVAPVACRMDALS